MVKVERYEGNPLFGPVAGSGWREEQTRNPGGWRHEGVTSLVFTGATDRKGDGRLVLGLATSSDGRRFDVHPEPVLEPSPNPDDFDHGSVEDARVTRIDDTFYVTYAARSFHQARFRRGERRPHSPSDAPTWTENFRRSGLLATKDFLTYEKLGPITSDRMSDANVILFPEKIGGRYAMLHRPSPFVPSVDGCAANPDFMPSIRYATSSDLLHWEDSRLLAAPQFDWEMQKIGGSGVPIPTDEGWLTIYHAKGPDHVYRIGAMLLDRENPMRILARSPEPIMVPEASFEREGTVPNVVFPCSNLVVDGVIHLYYGGADTVCCLATIALDELLAYTLEHKTA